MEENEKKINSRSLLVDEIKYLIPYFLCLLIAVASFLTTIIMITKFIDDMVNDSQGVKVSLYIGPIIIGFAFAGVFLAITSRIKVVIISKITNRLTKISMESILASDMYENDFEEKKKYISRVVSDIRSICGFYINKNFLQFLEKIVVIVAALVATLVTYGIGGIILLFITPFFIVLERIFEVLSRKSRDKYHEVLKKKQDLFDKTTKDLVKIKLLNGKQNVLNELDDLENEYVSRYTQKSIYQIISNSCLLVFTIGISLSLAYGISVAFDYEALTIGKLVFMTLITPIYFILIHVATKAHLTRKDISLEEQELYDIIHMKEEDNNEPVKRLDDIYNLCMKNVSFNHLNDSGKDNLLNNIDFEIKKGESIGIYSSNKEEKEAIFEALTRIRGYKSGHITINNCEIEKINIDYLRSIMTPLKGLDNEYSGTIQELVSYPNEYDDYKYNDAINRSGLSEFVNGLPDKGNTIITKEIIKENKYDELLEHNNDSLFSRICLANAIYQDTKIYLLDDFCNNNSSLLEKEALDVLLNLKGKIVILLTDHYYLLSKCDKILIIEDGKVKEYGKKDELINNKHSYYYDLVKNNIRGKIAF